jgi:hypothetical protein
MLRNITKRWAAFLAAFALLLFFGIPEAMAQLTVDPDTIYSSVESSSAAAALIGVAVAGVVWVIRFIKKGLRVA